MDTVGRATKEQNIKDLAEELRELLHVLLQNVDNLVERNPKPEEPGKDVAERPDNVFDEISKTLSRCRGLVREATEKVQEGISRKVH